MITFDEEELRARIQTLEAEMLGPGFWEVRDRAKEISQELERDRSLLSRYVVLREELEEVGILLPMAEEMQDEQELGALAGRVDLLEQKARSLRMDLYFSGPYDTSDAYLSINAGAGGTDSQDWASMLLRMYGRFCERTGFKATLLDASPGETAGIRSATLEVKGRCVYGYLKGERGVHRLVRMSPFDAAHRRHTSFCAVSVVPVTEEVTLEIDPRELRIDTYRSTGPGGQGVNTTDSAVRITHLPTGLVVSCQNERSQRQNKETAMKVLRARLGELLRRQHAKKLEELQGELKEIEWGSQIRSYVLQPYQMVKDHRTDVETGNVEAVLDGDLVPFLEAYLEGSQNEARPHERRN